MTYSDAQSESRKGWLRMPASLADQAYEGLLAAIGEGRLRPGDRVRETALAEELGISRTPIREALQRLARRPEESRVGKGCGDRVSCPWTPAHKKKTTQNQN